MILTAKQEEGLKTAVQRYKDGEKYTIISGYAGSGKSTLVRFIIDAIGINHSKVCYATFTGKAAEVLHKKGNDNVMTLHRLLYRNILKEGTVDEFIHEPRKYIDYDIVVVDEISMVPNFMIQTLFKHNCYVIGLGDPFQLPPVNKDENNGLLDNPHVFLEEIMRQAKESEIIRLSMDVRAMKPLYLFQGNEVQIISKHDVISGMLTWADIVIVATNMSRISYNNTIRDIYGYGKEPVDGEKVVCLKNYWENFSENGDALVNGTIGYLQNPKIVTLRFPNYLRTDVKTLPVIKSDIVTDDDIYYGIKIDRQKLMTGEDSLSWPDLYSLVRAKKYIGDIIPKDFAYGYAITCHKAQGSQWPKVLIQEEKFPFDRKEHARWLYTAITRAEEKVVIIKK